MDRVDAVVVGAGVVGLAVARQLAGAGLGPIILDAESDFGTGTSARNSEVIHAGIYYPKGSLKASLCVRGRQLLYRYCADRNVPHRRLGKLIFAASTAQVAQLDQIESSARDAQVNDLERLDPASVRAMEPTLECVEALLSPSTGIIDSHAYMTALLADTEAGGGRFVGRARVTRLSRMHGGWGVHLDGAGEPSVVAARVVNAAGLTAHLLARQTEGLAEAEVPEVRYARGVYFTYTGSAPFRHLIYPVPTPGGLGTHLTLDMAGQVRFGPDVEWIDSIDYHVDPARGTAFLAAARLIWPALVPARLAPGYAGIRAKLSGPGETPADFAIRGPGEHGQPGLVNLFGIESPGLTSSLAIADVVAAKLGIA